MLNQRKHCFPKITSRVILLRLICKCTISTNSFFWYIVVYEDGTYSQKIKLISCTQAAMTFSLYWLISESFWFSSKVNVWMLAPPRPAHVPPPFEEPRSPFYLENNRTLFLGHPRGPGTLLQVWPLPELFCGCLHGLFDAGPLLGAFRCSQIELVDLLGHFLQKERKLARWKLCKTH